ncbi:MAG: penicillin-binding protein 2 [Alphaproteobacteria bacterium]|jgi:cell division protein FtsI (penicillin-binding protein 3)|nr:penicillin-binding protein 2 [Alphaproteobacteria bacterium]
MPQPPPRPPYAAQDVLKRARQRLAFVRFGVAMLFTVVLVQLWRLPFEHEGKASSKRVAQRGEVNFAPARANILDRNGQLLATNLVTYSLHADPAQVLDVDEAVRKLTRTLPGLNAKTLRDRLEDPSRRFVWIQRNLTPQQFDAVNRLGLPGFDCKREERRVYPLGRTAAHILGYTDVDTRGVAGIEKGLDAAVRKQREPLYLSVDVRLQHILADELQQRVERFNALGGAGLVFDIQSGEILAMVSLPDFDPNRPDLASNDAKFNRASLGVYEMGSTFKVMNSAIAFDTGVANPDTLVDAINPIKVGRFTIDDYKGKNRMMSVTEVFQHSSNLGSARMAMAFGGEVQQQYLRAFGLLSRQPLEIPEVGEPMLPHPWREVSTMTVSFGHGISVNAVQLTAAVGAAAGNGRLIPPTLLRRERPAESVAVVKPEVALQMRKLLYATVEEGSGTHAAVSGYFIGGKTGSAEKLSDGGYKEKKLLSSFIGVFPVYAPRYAVLAILDEPKGIKETYGYATGGWTAAPVVGGVIERMAPLLGIEPKERTDPEVIAVLGVPKIKEQVGVAGR